MDLMAGASPVFKAPWPEWKLTLLSEPSAPADSGRLALRIGYCLPVEGRGPSASIEEAFRRERENDPVISTIGTTRSSLVPVVLVDGRPIGSGWGAIELRLAPGRHLVEVQSQHSRSWRAVEIHSGKTTRIDYVGMLGDQHRSYATGQVRGGYAHLHGHTLGPRGRLDYWQYLPVNAKKRRSSRKLLVPALLIPGTFYYGITIQTWMPDLIRYGLGAVLIAAIPVLLVIWGLRYAWTSRRFNRLEPEAPLDPAPFSPHGVVPISVLDHKGPVPEPQPGMAGLLIDARFIKADLDNADLTRQLPPDRRTMNRRLRRRLFYVGEMVPIRHRFAVPPPEILLDDRPIAASWTRMWLQLRPGEHTLEVRAPGSPLPVADGANAIVVKRVVFELTAGLNRAIDLTVTVKAVPDPTEPILHEWIAHIANLSDGSGEPEVGEAPRLDIAGDLDHSLRGNRRPRDRARPDWEAPGLQGNRFK